MLNRLRGRFPRLAILTLLAGSEAAGVEFTNGEQPGVRMTKAAAASSADASALNQRAAAKAARRKTPTAPEKRR